MEINASGTVEKESEATRALKELAGATERVGHKVGELSGKITPILLPPPPQTKGGPAKDTKNSSIFVNEIQDRTKEMDAIASTVSELISRCTL